MMCMVDTISMKTIPQDNTAREPLLQARIPQSLKRRVAAVAALKGGSSREIVIEALEDFLPRAEKEAAVLAGMGPKRA
jgi:hypothetical protein